MDCKRLEQMALYAHGEVGLRGVTITRDNIGEEDECVSIDRFTIIPVTNTYHPFGKPLEIVEYEVTLHPPIGGTRETPPDVDEHTIGYYRRPEEAIAEVFAAIVKDNLQDLAMFDYDPTSEESNL